MELFLVIATAIGFAVTIGVIVALIVYVCDIDF